MFIKPFVALALVTLSLARVVPLSKRTGKDHWWSGLETYDEYHSRYAELDCNSKHNTPFFDSCCHPRLKDADISQIPEKCLGSKDTCDDGSDGNAPAPSSSAPVNVAPIPSVPVSVPVDLPTTTPTHTTSTHTAPTHKPSPTSGPSQGSGSSGGSIKTGTGKGTYYLQNGVAGACGTVHPDSFKVVALDYRLYGNTGERSPLCGKTIHITNTENDKSVDAIIGDACPTCESSGSVDMSEGAFTEIATKEQGEVNIKWTIDM